MRTLVPAGVLLLSVLYGCGGGPNTPTPPSLAGRWDGTIASPTDAGGPITLQLTQTGSSVGGTIRLVQNGEDTPGTVTGTVNASSTTLQLTVTYVYSDGCQGTWSTTASVTGQEMAGQYSGHNCIREFVGTLHAARSN